MKYDHYYQKKLNRPPIAKTVRWSFYRKLFARINKVASATSVLEIGTGSADFARYCREQGIEYHGVEPNALMRSRAKAGGFDVYNDAIPGLSIEIPKVDIVFVSHVLEHLRDHNEILDSLDAFRAYLKPDGLVVLLYPEVYFGKWNFYGDYTHLYPTSRNRINLILKDADYDVMKSGHYMMCWIGGAVLISRLVRALSCLAYPLTGYFRRVFIPESYTIAKVM